MATDAFLRMQGFLPGKLISLGSDVVFRPDEQSEESELYFVVPHLLLGNGDNLPWAAVARGEVEIIAWARVFDATGSAPAHLQDYICGTVETSGFKFEVVGEASQPQPPHDLRQQERTKEEQTFEPGRYQERIGKRGRDTEGDYWEAPARPVDEWVQTQAHRVYLESLYATAALYGQAAQDPPMMENPVQRGFDEFIEWRNRDRELLDAYMLEQNAKLMAPIEDLQESVQAALTAASEANWAANVLLNTEAQSRQLQSIKWGMACITILFVGGLMLMPVMNGWLILRDRLTDASVWLEEVDRWIPGIDWPREEG